MNKLEMHGRLVQIITWIFSLSVIEYPIGRQRPVISFLSLTLSIGIFGYAYKNVIDNLEFNISHISFNNKIALVLFFLSMGFSYYVLGSVWFFRKEESECLRQLNEVTESISSISSDTDLNNTKRNKIIQIFFWVMTVYEIIYFWLQNSADFVSFRQFNKICCIFHHRITQMYINLIFVNYLRIIQLNFAKLNKKLKELCAFTDFSSSMSVYEIIQNISRIKQLHIRLKQVSRSFNDLYGICIFLTITLKFASMMYHLYSMYCISYNIAFDPMTSLYEIIKNCLWMNLHLSIIVIVIDACRLTAMEANKTGCRIFELSNSGSSMEMDYEIERVSVQLLQNPLDFTAHDFFVVDRGITFDIIMTLVSYFIFLVQVSKCEG